jgi:hypothetical protein
LWLKFCMHFSSSHACHMPHTHHSPWICHLCNIWRVKVTNLLIMQLWNPLSFHNLYTYESRYLVTTVAEYGAGWPTFNAGKGQGFFSSPPHLQTGSAMLQEPAGSKATETWSWPITCI